MPKGDDFMNQDITEKQTKTLTILLTKGPYVSEAADMALKTALEAKKKGYVVNVFLYLDGTWVAHLVKDKEFNNPGDWLKRVIRKNINVAVCERCSLARDLRNENTIEGAEISGTYKCIDFYNASDKVLSFGG
jgi:tRNA 2-thiouridine synthesizing protein D